MGEITKCEGCAFTSGTRANKSVFTLANVKLCVETRTPFYCHAVPERISKEQGLGQDEAVETALENGELPLCAGYVDAVKLLTSTGFYEQQTREDKSIGLALMETLDEIKDNPKMTERDTAIFLLSELERRGIKASNQMA